MMRGLFQGACHDYAESDRFADWIASDWIASKEPKIRVFWLMLAVIQGLPLVASAQLEEVVVSTRRREESLQDVPIAVSAITSEQIERQGISDLKDLVANQPSVQFDQSFGPADNRITIRGLSNTRGRSNVAFLVDGIDVTTENLISAGSGLLANRRLLTDVERIEIVKGPQSALFGRAAFAGAFNYITKEPGDEFDGRVGFDIGDYGRRVIEAAFGGPVTDTVGVRVAGVKFNEDGFYTNSISGKGVGGSNGYGAALTTVWKPADPVKVKARFEYSDEQYDLRPVVNIQGIPPISCRKMARALHDPLLPGTPALRRPGLPPPICTTLAPIAQSLVLTQPTFRGSGLLPARGHQAQFGF